MYLSFAKANKNLFLVVLILDYTSLVYMKGCVMKNDFHTVYELQHKCMLCFFFQKLTYKMNYFSGYGLPRFSKDLTSEFQLKPEVPAIVCSKMYRSYLLKLSIFQGFFLIFWPFMKTGYNFRTLIRSKKTDTMQRFIEGLSVIHMRWFKK